MGDGVGFGLLIAWSLFLSLSYCHCQDTINDICKEEYEKLKDYEKCVEETEYFRDLNYARKER